MDEGEGRPIHALRAGDGDRAEEIDDESPESYTERKAICLMVDNPAVRGDQHDYTYEDSYGTGRAARRRSGDPGRRLQSRGDTRGKWPRRSARRLVARKGEEDDEGDHDTEDDDTGE